jgi:uncharacterized protein YbaR (Trm112 family)
MSECPKCGPGFDEDDLYKDTVADHSTEMTLNCPDGNAELLITADINVSFTINLCETLYCQKCGYSYTLIKHLPDKIGITDPKTCPHCPGQLMIKKENS